ncbi:toll/interleukin-1 receptor domain-containing protein [Phenylobacterium sp.]|jgi:hypothetical protein|uniref:toll/interleukin-1 receptor domain-containing protein n=1 Tax=Phenylobacterium sp. TaxID=1871053 RepID=UPI000C98FD36|nr:toll/interleukin-1 receptor domain-containing protein [Phenylobacterium sp.]MAK81333.1 hypothetical protein [Phenylobacterium sp.]|tara:strand:+ start:2559 stop:3932 length:1374 start_codon:yes stop_codon:yes gene_type:complete
MLHDVFICHASEDKDDCVRPLAELLRAQHLAVWYDEFSLNIGDSLRESIDRGLANSRFGIVVLSPHFFAKRWAQRELNGLVSREIAEDRRLVLPVWHEVGQAEILKHSPPLADVLAVSTARGIDFVAGELLKKLRPEESPLIVARDFLIAKGVTPPVVTDEWWLDLVEIKESVLRFPDLNHGRRWIFPLPHRLDDRGRARGLNLGWSALQMDWAEEGEDLGLCQLSPPDQVHAFLRRWPGLMECARDNPGTLAMYAPQLTIPGLDDGFADVFDDLMAAGRKDAYQSPGYGGPPETTDGEPPLCGELIAWRHPTFGNYASRELSYTFVDAHNLSYSRKSFNAFECLAWLLSDAGPWMPAKLRETLIEGMRDRPYGWSQEVLAGDDDFADALLRKSPRAFRFTRSVKAALVDRLAKALAEMNVAQDASVVAARFMDLGFVDDYYLDEQRRTAVRRRGRS